MKAPKKIAAAKKKAVKKTTVKRKTTAVKKSPAKKPKPATSKPKKVTTKKKVVKKTPKKTAVKTLKPKRKATIPDSFKKGDEKPFSFPQSISLAVVGATRLPVDLDALASGMARYGGLGMVVLGGFFSALLAFGQITTTQTAAVPQALNFEPETNTAVAAIDVPVNTPITTTAPVLVSVTDATAVTVDVRDSLNNLVATLPPATQVAPATWETVFDPTAIPAGVYLLEATVTTSTGVLAITDDLLLETARVQSETGSSTVTLLQETGSAQVITGQSEPNSATAVTLYRNAQTVTVNTDENGIWTYESNLPVLAVETSAIKVRSMDLEAEKTAAVAAYTNNQQALALQAQTLQQDLETRQYQLLIAALSVVAIGVLLLLLGMKRREMVQVESQS